MDMPDVTKYAPPTGKAPVDDSVLLSDSPTLASLVGDPEWANGVGKGERMLVTIWKASGAVVLVLKVANPALKLPVEGQGYDEAVAALEAALKLPICPWQVDDKPIGKPYKKGK